MAALGRAFRAGLYLVIHIALALLVIAGIHTVQLSLIAVGDPKLFDLLPVRYIFDALDVGVLMAFLLFGVIEAQRLYQEQYRDERPGERDTG